MTDNTTNQVDEYQSDLDPQQFYTLNDNYFGVLTSVLNYKPTAFISKDDSGYLMKTVYGNYVLKVTDFNNKTVLRTTVFKDTTLYIPLNIVKDAFIGKSVIIHNVSDFRIDIESMQGVTLTADAPYLMYKGDTAVVTYIGNNTWDIFTTKSDYINQIQDMVLDKIQNMNSGLQTILPNAITRTQASKNSEFLSITDFGAVGDGVTDNTLAITKAVNSANGKTLYVPKGKYIIAGNISIPSNAKFEYEAGARITTSGIGKITDTARHFGLFAGRGDEYRGDTKTEGMYLELNSPLTGSGASSSYMINRILISDDRIDAQNDNVAGSKVDGMIIQHNFGGAGARGGRHALETVLNQNAPTELDGQDTNYVGHVAVVVSNTGDGGTLDKPRGEYFAANFYAVANNAQHINHLNGCESNAVINHADATVKYRAGYSAVSGGVKQATDYDAAYAIGALDVTGAAWKYGILAGRQNGRRPITDALIRIENADDAGSAVISFKNGIVRNLINSETETNFNFAIDNLSMFYSNASVQLGSKTVSNTPFMDFYAGESVKTGRIIATPTVAGDTNGTFNIQFRQTYTRDLLPSGDNSFILGAAPLRWSTIYAGTGTINTSDERLKTGWAEIEEAEKQAALEIKAIIKRYKFIDSVNEKGDKARIHWGVSAQSVAKILNKNGLNANEYAFFCYDEWQAVEEVKDAEGNIIIEKQDAGNRYGIRYDELAMFILASI